jgi:CRISPR-associated protein Cmr6
MLPFADIPTFWKNYWLALDQVGDVAQQFAQLWKHDLQKKALGLPRNVRPPIKGAFQAGPRVQKTGRHASPVFYHLARGPDGNLVVRITAFPAPQLPDVTTSQTFLQMLLAHFLAKLSQRVLDHKNKGPVPPVNPGSASDSVSAVQALTAGSRVEAILAEDPKGQGRPFARLVETSRVGPIINAKDMAADQAHKQVGDKVILILHSISSDGKQIQFRWPTPADSQPRHTRPQGGPPRRGGPGGRPHRK